MFSGHLPNLWHCGLYISVDLSVNYRKNNLSRGPIFCNLSDVLLCRRWCVPWTELIYICPGCHTGNQHRQGAAGDHKHVGERKFTEGVKVEIIHKPKELKVFVNKSPVSREESVKNDSKKDWQQIQSEMIKNGIKTSSNQGKNNVQVMNLLTEDNYTVFQLYKILDSDWFCAYLFVA